MSVYIHGSSSYLYAENKAGDLIFAGPEAVVWDWIKRWDLDAHLRDPG